MKNVWSCSKYGEILYCNPKQNSAPVSLKLKIKSEVRMKTHNTRKRTGDQTSFSFLTSIVVAQRSFTSCFGFACDSTTIHIFH
jgi:hypothetical protein